MNAITTYRPGANALRPQTMSELMTFAQAVARSQLVPRDYLGRPDNVLVAVQMGSELGLAPMQALQNISVINGRPAVWGDAMLGLVRASGLCEWVRETMDGETAVCSTKRRDDPNIVTVQFGDDEAKAAGLLGKSGPWQQYRQRMKQMRARGFCLRDAYPDVLRGLISGEEARDIPADSPGTIDVVADRVQPQSTAEYLGDTLPPDEPPPVPDPLATLRDRLARCADRADVLKVGDGWGRTLAKAEAAGKALPTLLVEAAKDMLADRLGAFSQSQPDDNLAAALDDIPVPSERYLDAG